MHERHTYVRAHVEQSRWPWWQNEQCSLSERETPFESVLCTVRWPVPWHVEHVMWPWPWQNEQMTSPRPRQLWHTRTSSVCGTWIERSMSANNVRGWASIWSSRCQSVTKAALKRESEGERGRASASNLPATDQARDPCWGRRACGSTRASDDNRASTFATRGRSRARPRRRSTTRSG